MSDSQLFLNPNIGSLYGKPCMKCWPWCLYRLVEPRWWLRGTGKGDKLSISFPNSVHHIGWSSTQGKIANMFRLFAKVRNRNDSAIWSIGFSPYIAKSLNLTVFHNSTCPFWIVQSGFMIFQSSRFFSKETITWSQIKELSIGQSAVLVECFIAPSFVKVDHT